jgi:malonyl-CoA/methylmalonyl-CoA synthetase
VIDIRGPNVFKGNWRMPEEEFRPDGFFISGDLGYIDQNGYVYISGRAEPNPARVARSPLSARPCGR